DVPGDQMGDERPHVPIGAGSGQAHLVGSHAADEPGRLVQGALMQANDVHGDIPPRAIFTLLVLAPSSYYWCCSRCRRSSSARARAYSRAVVRTTTRP